MIHLTLPVTVWLTDGHVELGIKSWVTNGDMHDWLWQSQPVADSKAPMLSGMETRRAAKLLTEQEHETSPRQGLSSPRAAEHSFPSPGPALGDAKLHGGLSRLRSTPVVLHFWGWSVHPSPSFSHRAESHSNFSLPIQGWFMCPKDTRRHLTTPVLQNREQSGESSLISLSPTQLCSCHQKGGQKRAVQHIVSLLLYLLFCAALQFL